MLAFLLDENLSDTIAQQVRAKRPDISIASVYDWEQGRLRGVSDLDLLQEAARERWTLVSYDVATLPLLLVRLANKTVEHSGVVLAHNATIRSNDYGTLVRALIQLYDAEKEAHWQNRLYFLPPPR